MRSNNLLASTSFVFSSWFALSAVVTGCASAPPPPPPKPEMQAAVEKAPPRNELGAANAAFESGDYAAAKSSYERILANNPDDLAAAYNLAVTLHRMGNLEAAKVGYRSVLAKAPDDVEATLNLGAILKSEGDVDEAIALYEKALKKDEYNPDLLNNLSALLRTKRDFDKAIKNVRKLLMRDQHNIDAYKNLALVYADQKKFKLAQTILENALKMAKKKGKEDADIYVNLGMVFLAQKETGKAMAAFKKAIEIEPDHVVANNNIGALALSHRDYDLAAKTYEVVVKAWPTNYDALTGLGYAYQGLQRLPEAAKQLERARETKFETAVAQAGGGDDGSEVLLQLMIIYQNADDADAALKWGTEYMKSKKLSCGEDDLDGFCGRYNGVRLMKEMKNQAPAEEEAPKATGRDIFTDGPGDGDAAPAPEGAPDSAADGATEAQDGNGASEASGASEAPGTSSPEGSGVEGEGQTGEKANP